MRYLWIIETNVGGKWRFQGVYETRREAQDKARVLRRVHIKCHVQAYVPKS